MSINLSNINHIKGLGRIRCHPFYFEGSESKFLWISRRISVRNSWLLLGKPTQIGAKIAVLRGTAYPELGLLRFIVVTTGKVVATTSHLRIDMENNKTGLMNLVGLYKVLYSLSQIFYLTSA